MAHEIRNALVVVKTFIDLLLDKNRDDELADMVKREMTRMNSLISQMLKFAGPARPSFASVRVHDVLTHSLRMVQHEIDGKLISLTRKFDAKPDTVHGDEYQLEQAFLNLLLNAVEASGPGGALTVETELIAVGTPRLCVSVTDNGSGIASGNMAHLFEPFFTTKENGTGLGLHITRRIIHEHDGQIGVESETNKGTTFSVLLPVAPGTSR
jgi:signal transduction histidine kinase